MGYQKSGRPFASFSGPNLKKKGRPIERRHKPSCIHSRYCQFLMHSFAKKLRYQLWNLIRIYHTVFVCFGHFDEISLSEYDSLLGTRIGEAKNPGPSDLTCFDSFHDDIKLVVINPTALHEKHHEIFAIDAHCYCLAETSATETIQKTMTTEARKNGYTCFWSAPVKSRQLFDFERDSLRGESLGTCCITDLPCRNCPVDFTEDVLLSSRLSHNIVRIGSLDVLIIVFYGTTGYTPESRRANDYLLASAFQLLSETRLPTIVAGDFNIKPKDLPSFALYQELGYVDAFEYFENRWGFQLPPTCNQKTRHDTFLIPRILQPYIKDIQVLEDHSFDKHSPMRLVLDIPYERPYLEKWNMPKSWKDLNLMPALVQSNYSQQVVKHDFEEQIKEQSQDFESLIQQWSGICESAVDKAIFEHHAIDPASQPLKGLPLKYKGRCIERKKVKKMIQNPVLYSNDSYNPNCLAFNVKSKQKVRQVRRLQSLSRSMYNFYRQSHLPPDYDRYLQWKGEWTSILAAKGYGRSWSHWLLLFEPIEFVPYNLPSCEWLDVALQLTQHDAELTCQQECVLRKEAFRLKLQFDRQDNYMKNTYKMLKDKPFPPINSVEMDLKANGTLCRSKKGKTFVRIDDPNIQFSKDRELHFGPAVCELAFQEGSLLCLVVSSGTLPSKALVTQTKFAMNNQEVSDAFRDFWSPFWNRDHRDDLVSDQPWQSIIDIVKNVAPIPEMDIQLDNPEVWIKTVKKLKKGKAAGYDGWFADDLKILPDEAIRHLCFIAAKVWDTGFSAEHMQARTILLAKVEKVKTMSHCRPITILGQIYRLMTKIAADQILTMWAYSLPPTISGGIPGRGSRLLMLAHQCRLEKTILEKGQLGGFVLDLIKAFNCIPRRPLVHMMLNAGVPIKILTFWMSSLSNLSRLPQLGQSLGEHVFSTSGIPEGDSMSVCGMIALAYHYHQHITQQFNQIIVSVYADNWSWISRAIKQNFGALLQTMTFTSAIRMQIDFDKSWAYAIGKDFKKSLENLELLFPDGCTTIHIVDDAKELGVRVKYSKKIRLGPIADKIEDANRKLYKISWMQTDLRSKSLLTRAIWQKVFYGLEGLALGERHFTKLRRSAANLLVGAHEHASTWISCHYLQKHMIDPQLFVLCEMFCLLRQLACLDGSLANDVCETASKYEGQPPKQSWGPATALAVYGKRLSFIIHPNGDVGGPEFTRCNILHDPCKKIKKFLLALWERKVVHEIEHRKGVPDDVIFNRNITLKVLEQFSDPVARGLSLNITGGFQSGALKHMIYEDHTDRCPYCDMVDTKYHRLIECTMFEDIRKKHQDAIAILKDEHPEWIHLPLPVKHRECSFFNLVMSTKIDPVPHDLFCPEFPDVQQYTIFTDGTCCDSDNILARRAGYSIVLDFSSSTHERLHALEKFSKDGKVPECFRVHTTSHVTGSQDPARAELSAVVQVVRCHQKSSVQLRHVCIYTDSAYVVTIIRNIGFYRTSHLYKEYHTQNLDLVDFLLENWDDSVYKIEKVKAHEDIDLSEGVEVAWKKLGNFVADGAAKSSLKTEVADVISLSNSIVDHDRSQRKKSVKYTNTWPIIIKNP